MKLIKRLDYLNKLRNVRGTPDIKVITGIRRSGKSKLLESYIQSIIEEDADANVIHIDFNNDEFEKLLDYHELLSYVKSHFQRTKNNYLLIDDGESWFKNKMGIAVLAWNQPYLKITGNFKMPNEIYQGDNTETINEIGLVSFLSRCGSLGNLPENFAVPEGVTNVNGMFFECRNLRGTIQLPSSAKYFKGEVDSTTQFLLNAGISAEPLENKNHAITLRIYKNSVADEFFTNNKMDNVDIEYIGTTSSQSSTNAIAMIQKATNKIVIEDSTDEISVTVNKVSQNEKISIEDETEYVTVTVNKKSTDESDEEGSTVE